MENNNEKESRSPDIEIYIADIVLGDAEKFIANHLSNCLSLSRSQPESKKARYAKLSAEHQGHEIAIVINENIAENYTSIWFNSCHTPWENDEACAKQAWEFFSKAIRFNKEAWCAEGDEDLWWQLDSNGESTLQWPTTEG